MNCRRCSGLMVPDFDPESVTGKRCVNCGSDGIIRERPAVLENDPPEHGCTFYTRIGHRTEKYYCGERRKHGSKYCAEHYELTQEGNRKAVRKKAKVGGPAIPFVPMGIGRGRRG